MTGLAKADLPYRDCHHCTLKMLVQSSQEVYGVVDIALCLHVHILLAVWCKTIEPSKLYVQGTSVNGKQTWVLLMPLAIICKSLLMFKKIPT